MKFRPKKAMVKHALDNLVIGLLLEPSEDRLDYLKTTLDRLQDMGYNLKSYTKMYEELKEDYEQQREKWRGEK